MKSLSPFEIGLVCSSLKSVIKINSDTINILIKMVMKKEKLLLKNLKRCRKRMIDIYLAI